MAYLDNIRTFVRVYELGNMSAAARDLRVSAAVASSRISQLEDHLGVRLFHRTTRTLTPTEQGKTFYSGPAKSWKPLRKPKPIFPTSPTARAVHSTWRRRWGSGNGSSRRCPCFQGRISADQHSPASVRPQTGSGG